MTASNATTGAVVLSLAHITKRFGTNTALDDVSFALRAGTVHAVLGENGAGKTTLMRIAFGLVSPDTGEARARDGKRISSPIDAIASGIGMVHQHFTNVAAMTVAENVALGRSGRFRRADAEQLVADIGINTGLALDARSRAGDLSVGAQQRLEIVKALARDAAVLILDEPTAVLAPNEIEELLRWIRGFVDAGNAVVLITHKLHEALAVADDVTVLRRGRVALAGPAASFDIGSLARALLGEDAAPADVRAMPPVGSEVAVAQTVSVVGARGALAIRDASFSVRGGEIVGVAAVEGAGQHELLRALAGRTPIAGGTLRLPHAIGFVPEDRHRDALVLEFTTTENMVLKGAGARRGRIRWSAQRERTRAAIAHNDVRGGDERTPIRALSGGNQQKLILARELDDDPRLVVVENPTRGLDIRATRAVHDRLRSVASAGAGVVVYSSDLDEVLALATRILVVHGGVVSETARDRETVGRAMLGIA